MQKGAERARGAFARTRTGREREEARSEGEEAFRQTLNVICGVSAAWLAAMLFATKVVIPLLILGAL